MESPKYQWYDCDLGKCPLLIPLPRVKQKTRDGRCSLPVLLVQDLLHPVDARSVERLRDRDVSHPLARGCALPMLDARGKPDHVARQYLFPRAALDLHPSADARRLRDTLK